MSSNVIERKPGRPRAIPEERESEVISIYKDGLGYRATARELKEEGLSVDWSTVRRLIKEKLDENLNYKLIYCPNQVKRKLHNTFHHELNYCQGVVKTERYENPRQQLRYCHMTIPEKLKMNLNQR